MEYNFNESEEEKEIINSVENELDSALDETVAEQDNPTERIVLCLVDLLLQRFPLDSVNVLQQLQ